MENRLSPEEGSPLASNLKWVYRGGVLIAPQLEIDLRCRVGRWPKKARPVGFEPTTLGSEDRCAIQLRHGRVQFRSLGSERDLFNTLRRIRFKIPCLPSEYPVYGRNNRAEKSVSMGQFDIITT